MKRLFAAALLAALLLPAHARADKPALTKLEFATVICNQKSATPADAGDAVTAPEGAVFVKMECSAEDLKTNPFLAELTQDPIPENESYTFSIARVEDTLLKKPMVVINMQNPTLYTDWGAAAGYGIAADGSYHLLWKVKGGTVGYTLSCPTKFSYVMHSSAKKNFAEWIYNGTTMTQSGEYDSPENFPDCIKAP